MYEELYDGIFRIEVPLPNNPLKSTNSYVFSSTEGGLVLDTGLNQPVCRQALAAGLDALGLDLAETDFLITHLHADHLGLAASLVRPGRRVWMGEKDAYWMETAQGWEEMMEHGRLMGVPQGMLEAALKAHPGYRYGPGGVIEYTHLSQGDAVRVGAYELRVIETPGHSWGHICLYEPRLKVLFSGDHVLGDITPNIQHWSAEGDSLGDYVNSLDKVAGLEFSRVLPGHRSLIEDGKARIAELKAHHVSRLNEVLEILARRPMNAYDCAGRMSWDIKARSWEDFPVAQRWFATGEAIAHLRYLERRGFIGRETTPEGFFLFQPTGRGPLKTLGG